MMKEALTIVIAALACVMAVAVIRRRRLSRLSSRCERRPEEDSTPFVEVEPMCMVNGANLRLLKLVQWQTENGQRVKKVLKQEHYHYPDNDECHMS